MQLIICDECTNEFFLHLTGVLVDVENSVRMYYIECPACKHRTIVFYKDTEIERMQKLQRELLILGRPMTEKERKMYFKNKNEIKRRMRFLKEKYAPEN